MSEAIAECRLCAKGFPIKEGDHYGTQSLGMIPTTRCTNAPAKVNPIDLEAMASTPSDIALEVWSRDELIAEVRRLRAENEVLQDWKLMSKENSALADYYRTQVKKEHQ